MEDMLSSIRHYLVLNVLLHANLTALIKDNKFATLAKRLHDDYCYVPRLAYPLEGIPSILILHLIEAILDLWFDRDIDYQKNTRLGDQRRRFGSCALNCVDHATRQR